MGRYGDEAMGELRPATVEQLAAQERSGVRSHRRPPGRPLIVALATGSLMVSGAGAFALARTGPNATMVQPYGPDAPFGVGYVDGFGEHSPHPSGRPTASATARSDRPAGTESGAPVGLLPSSAGPVAFSPSPAAAPAPSPSRSSDGVASPPASVGEVMAVYWTTTWYGNYDTYVWVHNRGSADAAWEVRVKLPDGATVGTTMAASRSYVDGMWIFKPSRGSVLPGGRVYLFAFSGRKPDGRFSLRSCTVNGRSCNPFA